MARERTFAEAVALAQSKADAYDKSAVAAAFEKYHRDGEIEIDGGVTSRGDDELGCYVMAWVWVYRAEIEAHEEQ